MPVPPTLEETVEVTSLVPCERVQRTVVHVPVPRILGDTVEVTSLARHERAQQRTVDAPMPQVLEETVEVDRLVPQERVQQRTVELRTQLERALFGDASRFGMLLNGLTVHVLFLLREKECVSGHQCCRCCTLGRRTGTSDVLLRAAAASTWSHTSSQTP